MTKGQSAPPCGFVSRVRLMPLMYALCRLTTLPRSNQESTASVAVQTASERSSRS